MRTRGAAAWVAVVALVMTGCSAGEDEPEAAPSPTAGSSTPSASPAAREPAGTALDPDDPALDAALSRPVEDRVYPSVGDPGVDALHYQLDLTWSPKPRTLDAVETLTFRATEDAEQFQLDFGKALSVTSLALDGEQVTFRERGKDLVVTAPVRADERYTLEVRYRGTPRPAPAPTTRDDFNTIGWQITDQGETWTMQEPFGAYSWYAVNDHPSDKALYDFTLTTTSPWVGVANGRLQSRTRSAGSTTTDWHLDEPAASYLVTVAFGNFTMTRDRSQSGVPMTYWTPRGDERSLRSVQVAADELAWLERRLGPYPFSSLGLVVVDSTSGMETQTMITLGRTEYTLSPSVVVHEMIHQWYGDQVTPRDWRDVWMNEGMAMYLQVLWEDQEYGIDIDEKLAEFAAADGAERSAAGPPADYDPATFGEGNIYYLPALMWDEVRTRVGDDRFWQAVRAWPRSHDNANAGYDDIAAWWSRKAGDDLRPLFDAWLLGRRSPPYPT
ncbi:M1 family aminopeptidase [Nocardioides sp.]|uniref:M1 family aminopeptidase n=1 Tax=Nocardioides sp. TaxID=35761 RepID=UPI002D7FDFDC|nr:M1 family aminopeptidase [Nocardioides sp.]HET8959333.1 M1 family aminopeptidase [Nocardioides sp.]